MLKKHLHQIKVSRGEWAVRGRKYVPYHRFMKGKSSYGVTGMTIAILYVAKRWKKPLREFKHQLRPIAKWQWKEFEE